MTPVCCVIRLYTPVCRLTLTSGGRDLVYFLKCIRTRHAQTDDRDLRKHQTRDILTHAHQHTPTHTATHTHTCNLLHTYRGDHLCRSLPPLPLAQARLGPQLLPLASRPERQRGRPLRGVAHLRGRGEVAATRHTHATNAPQAEQCRRRCPLESTATGGCW